MKKLLLLLVVFGFFTWSMTSCGGKKQNEANDAGYGEYETAEPEKKASAETPEELIKQGQALVDANDCKTCHAADKKIIGPSHTDVAKKYEFNQANVDKLANKIISGGSGVWGEIPMTPHPGVSQDDAKKMAMYVLSLDGEKANL